MFEFFIKLMRPSYYDALLTEAISLNRIVDLRRAMDNGADPYKKNAYGYSPLNEIVLNENKNLLSALISHPLFIFKEDAILELFNVMETGNLRLIPILLSKHDPDTVELDALRDQGKTVYIMAKLKGYHLETTLLLSHGARHEYYCEYLEMKRVQEEREAFQTITASEMADVVLQCMDKVFLDNEMAAQLIKFLHFALNYGCVMTPDMSLGIRNLDEIVKYFPINEDDPDKDEKSLVQCILAFMLAAKAPLGRDDPFNNKSFHMLYAKEKFNGGRDRRYCWTLNEFNREERRVLFKLKGYRDQIEEPVDWETLPKKEEMPPEHFRRRVVI